MVYYYATVYTLIAVMVLGFIYAVKKGLRQVETMQAETDRIRFYEVVGPPEPEPPLVYPFDREPWLSMYLDLLAYAQFYADSLRGDTDPRRPIVG